MRCFPPASRIFPQGIIEISCLDAGVLQLWVSQHLGICSLLLFYRRRSQVQALLADADLVALSQQGEATDQY